MNEKLGEVMVDDQPVAVNLNTAGRRFEIVVGPDAAYLSYALDGDVLSLLHTEVPTTLRGKKLADVLARTALDYARAHARKVEAHCPFVEGYIARHAEYADLTATA